ncbi:hypothetical protein VFPPC_14774 [Pochonia chlamydosporia 170]|uniref:Uncharacterized protein n=1 Tax=Pochonia chlamydosporia 170 TaxID=1380566 RepID=A0A179F1Z1_METCM|nr:hypothetical protein VFPPC_14774 [Pochonia chlamydosporia 170]OAQ59448.1 hypothetical protein VFPPC_14774 [Pochonia chlamydosporia 170]
MEVVDVLPAEEQRLVWCETERKFWYKFDNENDVQNQESEQRYKVRELETRADLDILTTKRAQLTERQERLFKELTQVKEELAQVVEECNDRVAKLDNLEQNCRQSERERLEERKKTANNMERFFRIKRGEDPSRVSGGDRDHLREVLRNTTRSRRGQDQGYDAARAEALQQADKAARTIQVLTPPRSAPLPRLTRSSNVLVHVVDADGHLIGPVEKIDIWNQWVEAIQEMPIERQVKIRRGRKFTSDHLSAIYDRSEAKGVKWLACMIQATGEIQQWQCHSCDKNQGAFADCIVLGGPLFQKCGNCEWNRQGCHMPLSNKSANTRETRHRQMQSHSAGKETEPSAFRVPPVNQSDQNIRPYESREAELARSSGSLNGSPILPEPVRMPTSTESREHALISSNYATPSGFTPINFRSRPPSRDIPTPSVQSAENPPQPMGRQLPSSDEITRSNLVLRHNGTVYVYPECVEGVPLVKIDEAHPYWDPCWPRVRSLIEPQVELWRGKYADSLERKAKGEGGSSKFHNGRQVNRGMKVLEFLQDGEISPYQLLSKQYTQTGKGIITAYDTLFRMCETLGELAKYTLDISPVEWLRHRLHELILEHGAKFNYSNIMHNFYHDPKLAALRSKNGYKSIGRPSRCKASQTIGNDKNTSQSGKKRKSMHSQTATPRATPSASYSPLMAQEDYSRSPLPNDAAPLLPENSFHTPIQKRLKPSSPHIAKGV